MYCFPPVSLPQHMQYANGYSKSDPTIINFWKTFHDFPEETKRKFLSEWMWSHFIPSSPSQ